jgi:DNA gyrase subunit B
LLLTFFFRYMEPLIHEGFLYIAQPPLYSITNGKAVEWAYTEKQRDGVLKGLGVKKAESAYVQRYKGLGEMNPEQLWSTTMDPAIRILLQVNVDDAKEADHVFSMLMGDEVAPRKRFIQTHAKEVQNLDV